MIVFSGKLLCVKFSLWGEGGERKYQVVIDVWGEKSMH